MGWCLTGCSCLPEKETDTFLKNDQGSGGGHMVGCRATGNTEPIFLQFKISEQFH